MKKLMLSLALVTGLALASSAQDSPTSKTGTQKKQHTPEEHAKHGAKWATKNLGLTADQTPKWEAAALTRINANAPLREKLKGSTTPDERKATHQQMKANMEKFDAEVNGFLTPEQKTKWEKIKADKKAKHKAIKGGEEVDLEPEK
ncbi:MAG: hypothetical protein SFY56_06190 [Bacteroidota bacterium]|nr:hypothetical protein [Bacteroidota bacterium]